MGYHANVNISSQPHSPYEYPLPLFIRCRILFGSGFKETADGLPCQREHQQPAELAVQNIRCLF